MTTPLHLVLVSFKNRCTGNGSTRRCNRAMHCVLAGSEEAVKLFLHRAARLDRLDSAVYLPYSCLLTVKSNLRSLYGNGALYGVVWFD